MSISMEAGGLLSYAGLVVLKATVLLGLAAVLTWALRRRTAAVRHTVWVAATAGVLSLSFLGAAVPALPVSIALPAWALPAQAASVATADMADGGGRAANDPAAAQATVIGSAVVRADRHVEASEQVGEQSAVGAYASRTDRLTHMPLAGAIVLGIWLTGALVMLSLTVLSLVRVRRISRRFRELRDVRVKSAAARIARELRVTRPIRLLEGDSDAMPLTFGVWRSTLVLPSSALAWSSERLNAVLRHELAHVKRRDSLTQLMADIGCALYWFHPGMWLAAVRLRVEREFACDDIVLLTGARASAYAAELLEIARTMSVRPDLDHAAALAIARPTRLRARLEAVLTDRPRALRVPDRVLLPFGVAAMLLVTSLAMITPSAAGSIPTVLPLGGPAPELQPEVLATSASATSPASSGSPAPGRTQAPECWSSDMRGTMITVNSSTGESTREQIVQHRMDDDVSLCMRMRGDVQIDASGSSVRSLGDGAWVVLAARSPGRDVELQIVGGVQGPEHIWTVNGGERAFDQDAQAWRDAMLPLMASHAEVGSIRGEVASLRGEIASIRGRRASLMGEIASIRGREASLRGEIASTRGRASSLRGEISSIRGHVSSMRGEISSIRGQHSSMRGEISSLRGRISSLRSARRATDSASTRAELDAEISRLEQAIERVERDIASYDVEGRVAEVEQRIAEYDAESRIRDAERQIDDMDDSDVAAIEARIADYDSDARIREVEARLAQLDVDGEVARIEQRIEAVQADRRIAEIEQRIETQEQQVREVLQRIRT